MDERVLTPSTSVLTVLVVGMVAGHVLMPARPDPTGAHRALFLLSVAGAGALGGWRVAGLRRSRGVAVRWLGAALGVALSLSLAVAGYLIVHG
jgi:hypothetical protein